MNMRTVIVVFSAVVLLCAASAFAGGPDMKPGQWEIVTKVVMEGMPFSMPPMKSTTCVTKEDLNDPKKTTPKTAKDDSSCEVKDYKMSGKKATWKIVCTGQNKGTGNGEITYAGTSYTGKIRYETGEAVMNYTIDGKRTGDCTK